MRLIVDKDERSPQTQLFRMRRAMNHINANIALKAIIKRDGEAYIKIDDEKFLFMASKRDDSADISQDADGIFKVHFPNRERWSKGRAYTPFDVVDVPFWMEMLIGEQSDGSPPQWIIDLGEHYVQFDLLAGILNFSVDELKSKTLALENGRIIPALWGRYSWFTQPTSDGLVDVRVVLAALIQEYRKMEATR